MSKNLDHPPFISAKEELPTLQESGSNAYELAFLDRDFLLHKDLRSVRLQLELLKPELLQKSCKIESTIVVFGSGRILDPEAAQQQLDLALRCLETQPDNPALNQAVKIAQHKLKNSHYYQQAQQFSQIVSANCQRHESRHFVIVTGGGNGIMEAANRGAHDVQAKSIGLNIVLPQEPTPNAYISPELCFQFHYFAIRKMHFLIRARALIYFPGGYGTLDELFETLTLLQTKKIKPIPLLLFSKAYWSRLINFNVLIEEGMIDETDTHLFHYVETAEEAWKVIAMFYQL